MRRASLLLGSLLGLGVLTGCADVGYGRSEPTYSSVASHELVAASYRAADALLAQLQVNEPSNGPVLTATLVNIDALDRSSTLGRMVSEQVSARFSQRGRSMIEMKLRSGIYVRRTEGELILTREIAELARQQRAQAILLGTYALGENAVFVNLKVVHPVTSVVLAASDYALPMNREIRGLLGIQQR